MKQLPNLCNLLFMFTVYSKKLYFSDTTDLCIKLYPKYNSKVRYSIKTSIDKLSKVVDNVEKLVILIQIKLLTPFALFNSSRAFLYITLPYSFIHTYYDMYKRKKMCSGFLPLAELHTLYKNMKMDKNVDSSHGKYRI